MTRGLSKAALLLPRSGIREVMAYASSFEDVIHLEVGQPDSSPSAKVLDAASNAAVDPVNHRYIPNLGSYIYIF